MPYRNPTSRQDIETALATGTLFVPAGRGKWWQARRNGQTKLWKRSPDAFHIPIKYGFRDCAAIEHTTDSALLRIAATRQEAEVA